MPDFEQKLKRLALLFHRKRSSPKKPVFKHKPKPIALGIHRKRGSSKSMLWNIN